MRACHLRSRVIIARQAQSSSGNGEPGRWRLPQYLQGATSSGDWVAIQDVSLLLRQRAHVYRTGAGLWRV